MCRIESCSAYWTVRSIYVESQNHHSSSDSGSVSGPNTQKATGGLLGSLKCSHPNAWPAIYFDNISLSTDGSPLDASWGLEKIRSPNLICQKSIRIVSGADSFPRSCYCDNFTDIVDQSDRSVRSPSLQAECVRDFGDREVLHVTERPGLWI